MPIYEYKCDRCSWTEEKLRNIDQRKQEFECKCGLKGKMTLQISKCAISTFGTGDYNRGGLKTIQQKQEHFKKRSANDNKKNGHTR